jgi:hypothetical protein
MARSAKLVLVLGIVSLSAGCGTAENPRPAPPRLPPRIADALAARSDALAAALAQGNSCAALRQAAGLRYTTRQAVAGGKVPSRLQQPLLVSVDRIVASVPRCVIEPVRRVVEPPRKEHGGGHGKGKHEGHGKHDGVDEDSQ